MTHYGPYSRQQCAVSGAVRLIGTDPPLLCRANVAVMGALPEVTCTIFDML